MTAMLFCFDVKGPSNVEEKLEKLVRLNPN